MSYTPPAGNAIALDFTAGGYTAPASTAVDFDFPALGPVSPYIQLTLVDRSGTARTALTGLKWAWFDQVSPDLLAAPTDKGAVEETDGSGVLVIELANTTLVTGNVGFLIISDTSGDPAVNSSAFAAPVTVQ